VHAVSGCQHMHGLFSAPTTCAKLLAGNNPHNRVHSISFGICYFENLLKSASCCTESLLQRLAQAVSILNFIPEVHGTNLVWDTECLDWFSRFSSAMQTNSGIVPWIRLRPPPCTSFPYHSQSSHSRLCRSSLSYRQRR
jgi:hypothetical protein